MLTPTRQRRSVRLCSAAGCRARAAYAFLGVTGDQADRVVDADGKRIRVCKPHLMVAVDAITKTFQQLPDGGPARIRAVSC